ncbi:MAG: hypothetical protein KDB90_03320 [Planctomycetes bacterium]|nr:hypothetical protein [Planctomycetota bacterium]
MRYQVFKSEEFRFGFGAGVITAALEKANSDAANWMDQYAHQIVVKHISTGMSQVFAYVTVWYEMIEGGSAL